MMLLWNLFLLPFSLNPVVINLNCALESAGQFLKTTEAHFYPASVALLSPSRVRLFVAPWTVAHQAPPSMGFSRQEYWGGLPFPSPGELPDPGIKPESPVWQCVCVCKYICMCDVYINIYIYIYIYINVNYVYCICMYLCMLCFFHYDVKI